MNLYVSARSPVQDLVIEYIEIILANGRCVNVQWAESSVKREKDDYTICFKRLQFDNGNYHVSQIMTLALESAHQGFFLKSPKGNNFEHLSGQIRIKRIIPIRWNSFTEWFR